MRLIRADAIRVRKVCRLRLVVSPTEYPKPGLERAAGVLAAEQRLGLDVDEILRRVAVAVLYVVPDFVIADPDTRDAGRLANEKAERHADAVVIADRLVALEYDPGFDGDGLGLPVAIPQDVRRDPHRAGERLRNRPALRRGRYVEITLA